MCFLNRSQGHCELRGPSPPPPRKALAVRARGQHRTDGGVHLHEVRECSLVLRCSLLAVASAPEPRRRTVTTVTWCERLERAFASVARTLRLREPRSTSAITSAADATRNSERPCTNTPPRGPRRSRLAPAAGPPRRVLGYPPGYPGARAARLVASSGKFQP